MLISKVGDCLCTPQPDNDTRPAAVYTRETHPVDLMMIEELLWEMKDDHRLIENYTIEQIERMHVLSLMYRDDKLVGFSGIQRLPLGNRILSRLYQIPDNRVRFTRELLRPTIHAMVEHQLLLGGNLTAREPRVPGYFKRFVEALNNKSTARWEMMDGLHETVPGSLQYIARTI